MNRTDRFKDSPYFVESKHEQITILGAGGIGSNTLLALSRSVQSGFQIFDMDKVEEHNTGTQFFTEDQIGINKTMALKETMSKFGIKDILPFVAKVDKNFSSANLTPIVITGFDNMEARKDAFELWCQLENRELFIDGRLSADYYEIFTVVKGQEDEYRKVLFPDAEAAIAPCTFKQTTYMGLMIGARISNIVINYLTNKYEGVEYCRVPFRVEEMAPLMQLKSRNDGNIYGQV